MTWRGSRHTRQYGGLPNYDELKDSVYRSVGLYDGYPNDGLEIARAFSWSLERYPCNYWAETSMEVVYDVSTVRTFLP